MSLSLNFHRPTTTDSTLYGTETRDPSDIFVAVSIGDEKGNVVNLFVRDREFLVDLGNVVIKALNRLTDAQDQHSVLEPTPKFQEPTIFI